MAKISGSDIRPGMVIEHDGSLWAAVKTGAVKPGKGPAYNQVELKNILDGRKLNQRFGSSDRVEETAVERRQFQFLYKQGEQLVFMDTTSYEQIELGEDFVGDRSTFLQDGMMVQVQLHGDRPSGIKLPETVVPVAIALLVGGVAILVIEAYVARRPKSDNLTWSVAIWVGLCQILAAVFSNG